MTEQQTHIDEDDNPFLKPELMYLAEEDYQLPPADPALLASANRMLHDRLERVAHVLRGCGLEKLKDITGRDDLQMATAALAGAYQMAKDDVDGLMAALIDKDERGTHIVRIVSTNQHGATSEQDNKVIIINESGLYHAVLRSRKPEARPFRKWVTAEVLPAIRKTGQYNTDKTAAPEQRVLDVEAISAANALSASYAATIQADLFNRLLQHGGRLDDFSARYLMSFGGYAPPDCRH